MPDSVEEKCALHELRLDRLEESYRGLETTMRDGFNDVSSSLKLLREKLLGNGTDGFIQHHDRRLSALELREAFDERVRAEVAKQVEVLEGRGEKQDARDEEEKRRQELTGTALIWQKILDTPVYAWALFFIILGPKGLEFLVGIVERLNGIWGKGP